MDDIVYEYRFVDANGQVFHTFNEEHTDGRDDMTGPEWRAYFLAKLNEGRQTWGISRLPFRLERRRVTEWERIGG